QPQEDVWPAPSAESTVNAARKCGRPRSDPRPAWAREVSAASGLLNADARTGGDVDVLGVSQEDEANDQRHYRDAYRIPEAGINIAGRRHDRCCKQREHAAEPAIADMVRQRHRGVA